MTELREQGAASYRSEIRNATRSLWNGAIDYDQFFDVMMLNIRLGLTAAWHSGMKSVGLLPTDMSALEKQELQQLIFSEINHIGPYADAIEQGSKANGGKLSALWPRAEMWINRYVDVENRARAMAQNDPKLEWQINVTRRVEHNCSTCLKLNGKVKRASYWQTRGLYPQNPPNPHLECQGWLCGCALLPTDKPLSRGPLPRTP